MAVLSCNEMWPGRDGNVDFQRRRTYTRTFEVYTNSTLDEAFVVSSAAGLPLRGQSYPFDFFARCISINPKQDEADPLRWTVECKYDSHPFDWKKTQPDGSSKDPKDATDNPLDDPPEWKFYFQEANRVLRTAYKRDPVTGQNVPGSVAVLNSAKVPFDPPPEYDYAYWCFSITGNLPFVDLQAMPELKNSVNLTTWKGWQPRCVRCFGHEATTGWKNNIPFWRVSYNFAIKSDTWDLRILDCGYEYIQNPGTSQQRLVKIILPGGREPTAPVPLDGNGNILPLGGTPVYLLYNAYKQREYNDLVPW